MSSNTSNFVRFNNENKPEFYRELNKRINKYFKENNISKHANLEMKIKTGFMLCLYFLPLLFLLTGMVSSFWPMMAAWVIMGFGMSGIGLSVMHDANHGAYSKSKKVNRIIGSVILFIGGYATNWIIQHNVLHHSFTNVHGHDEDIDKGIIRMSPNQDRKSFFRFQAFYAPVLYSLLTLVWLVAKDYVQLVRYNQLGLLEKQGLTFTSALFQILVHKIIYIIVTLVLPIMLIDLPWGQIVFGFLIMHFISGLILAFIFQPAHVIEETDFFVPDENSSVENSWAIHQLKTTSNFARKSKLFSWYVGGLNYQIEHHLFPHICHIHYKNIAPIVKQTAQEFNVPYHEHETFLGALKSHFTLLHKLGTGEYDRELALANAA